MQVYYTTIFLQMIATHVAGDTCQSAAAMVHALQHQAFGSLSDWTAVSSVYFDDADFQTYQSRLRREDKASVVRVRWYGVRSTRASQELYVERKVHREPWTGEKSFKASKSGCADMGRSNSAHGAHLKNLRWSPAI